MDKKILETYTNVNLPGSFSGIRGFLENNKNKFDKKEVEKTFLDNDTYTLHKSIKRKIPTNKFFVPDIDDTWQIDLIDVQKLKNKQYSQNFSYILVIIDVLSKYAWAEPMKDKTAEEAKKALEKILERSSPRKPKRIYSDHGNEFMGVFAEYLKKQNIQQLFTRTKYKASIAERFNRTLKEKLFRYFTHNKTKKYVDILQKMVNSYNNSFHHSIKDKPGNINESNKNKVICNLYSNIVDPNPEIDYIDFKFKVGDYVRIPVLKKQFEKGYTPNWSKEIYIVDQQIPTLPPKYKIKHIDNTVINNKYFYT